MNLQLAGAAPPPRNATKRMDVEHALGLVRGRLMEWVAEDDWCEHRWAALAQTVRECLHGSTAGPVVDPNRVVRRLDRESLRRVIAFVRDNLESKLTLEQIAAAVGMERFGIARRFKLTTGITLHQYVIRRRMRKAAKLLAESRASLADIALEVGCSCQSHFTTLFRRRLGTTPGEFRRRAAKPALKAVPSCRDVAGLFGAGLDHEDAAAIRAYLMKRSNEDNASAVS